MLRCLRIIKVVPRDVGNRMKKIELLSRGRRRRAVINAMISQEDTPRVVGGTSIKSDVRRYVSMYIYVCVTLQYLLFRLPSIYVSYYFIYTSKYV